MEIFIKSLRFLKPFRFLAFLVILFFVFRYFSDLDIDPIDDSDLKVIELKVNDNENALFPLLKLNEEIKKISDLHRGESIRSYLIGLKSDVKVKEFIKENESIFRIIDEVFEKERYYTNDTVEKFLNAEEKIEFLEWSDIIYLLKLRLRFNSNIEEEILKQLRFCRNILKAPESGNDHVIGVCIYSNILNKFYEQFLNENLSEKHLRLVVNELDILITGSAGASRAFKGEYHRMFEYLQYEVFAIKSGSESDFKSDLAKLLYEFGLFHIIYEPNKTHQLYADYTRKVVSQLETPVSEREIPDWYDHCEIKKRISYNALGKTLCLEYYLHLKIQLMLTARVECIERMLKVICLLNIYKEENGEYPNDLAVLGQGVPNDIYSGKPIKYDRKRKIIYSIGEDLIDDLGEDVSPESIDLEEKSKSPDVVLRFIPD